MVLQSDCIRDVLLSIEKLQRYVTNESGAIEHRAVMISTLYDSLQNYSKEDIYYTLSCLSQAGLISLSEQWAGDSLYFCAINHLTFAGHEFLGKIRDDDRWRGIKKAIPAIRNYSLDAINAISHGMTSAALNALIETYAK